MLKISEPNWMITDFKFFMIWMLKCEQIIVNCSKNNSESLYLTLFSRKYFNYFMESKRDIWFFLNPEIVFKAWFLYEKRTHILQTLGRVSHDYSIDFIFWRFPMFLVMTYDFLKKFRVIQGIVSGNTSHEGLKKVPLKRLFSDFALTIKVTKCQIVISDVLHLFLWSMKANWMFN